MIDTLVEMGVVNNEQLDQARQEADSSGEGVVDTLVAKKFVRSADVAQAKASTSGVEYINLGSMRLEDDVIKSVPGPIAKRF
ncbi:MAG TPA: type II/IV secretion system protein, partial [Verrucomicrobiae bacterium]|nr:type II/IV secretion system protein [Verrucomicrobiae bacterium]